MKENDNMKTATIATLIATTAMLATTSLTACIMEVESEDFDDPTNTEESADLDSYRDNLEQAELYEDTVDIALDPLVIEAKPGLVVTLECEESDDCVILEVRADHFGATIKILDEELTVIAEMNARNCPEQGSSYFHVCRVLLLPAPYLVEFGYVRLYEQPDDASVDVPMASKAARETARRDGHEAAVTAAVAGSYAPDYTDQHFEDYDDYDTE